MAAGAGPRRRSTPPVDYELLAELHYQVRRFLRVREEAARGVGLEPQQYVLLLQVKGVERHRAATVGVLAERLQIRHHGTVQLVDRLAERGMVRRRRAELDRRGVVVEVTPRGEAIYSLTELRTAGPALASALTRLIGRTEARRSRGPRATARSR